MSGNVKTYTKGSAHVDENRSASSNAPSHGVRGTNANPNISGRGNTQQKMRNEVSAKTFRLRRRRDSFTLRFSLAAERFGVFDDDFGGANDAAAAAL